MATCVGRTFAVEAHGVDEAAVPLQLLQQLAVDVVAVHTPRPQQAVITPGHHQVGRGRVVAGAVHEGWVGQHLLGDP